MLKPLCVFLFFSAGLVQFVGIATAQTPPPNAQLTTTAPGTPTTTSTPLAQPQPPSPPLAATRPGVADIPERTLSTDASVAATTVEDVDGDGALSSDDKVVSTLVELITNASLVNDEPMLETGKSRVISLFEDTQGTFRFSDIPPGNYVLQVWGFGFVGIPTATSNPGLFQTNVVVARDGKVVGRVPVQFLVKKKPEGVLGYPVRTGESDGSPILEGSANVGLLLGAPAPAVLPP